MDKYIIRAGVVMGLGLMGFFNGIVFHQLLQWHHFVCWTEYCKVNTVADLQFQIFTDGLYSTAMWIITLIGGYMLFRACGGFNLQSQARNRVFWGSLLIGGGAFDFIEGLIDHQLLGIHHVMPGPHQFLADMVFLAIGLILPLIGYFLIRRKYEF